MNESEMLYGREKVLRSLLKSWTGENKDMIRGFYKNCKGEGLSLARISRLLQLLRTADKYFRGPFDKLTKTDLENYYDYLGENMTPHSRYTYMTGLKQFYKWLGGGKYFDRINHIRLSKPGCPYTADDLYTEDDQERMIKAAEGPFWKAFLDGMRYSRCRPGEFILLKRKDIQINGMGIVLRIPKRKNSYSERSVIIKESCPHFRGWIERVKNPDKYLFLRDGWNYSRYDRMFKEIIKKAGVNKRARLYLFSHTRYTKDWELGISGETRDALYGHSPESRMRSYYLHLNQVKIDNELNRVYNNGHENEKVIIVNPWMFGPNN